MRALLQAGSSERLPAPPEKRFLIDNCWMPGLQIRYEHTFIHQVADFLAGMAKGQSVGPTFRDAQLTQIVCDAVLDSAKPANGSTSPPDPWRRFATAKSPIS